MKNKPNQNILLMETLSLLLFRHCTYFLQSAYHMKFKLFILTNHVRHTFIPYPFQFSQFSLFPFFSTFQSGKGSDPTKTNGSAHNHLLLVFARKETTFFALNLCPCGGSLCHQCLVEHIFPSCIHIHEAINKITTGKQKRMTRGSLLPASNYSSSQSPEECQETAKTKVYVIIVKYKEIFILVYKS